MIPINCVLDATADGNPFVEAARAHDLGTVTDVGRIAEGMASGKTSVVIQLTMPDGSKRVGQTSLALLRTVVQALDARDKAEGRPQ